MKCKECKTENKETAKFCVNCGTELKGRSTKKVETKTVEEKSKNEYVGMLIASLEDLKGFLLKPLESLKNKNTEDIKSTFVNGIIICFVMMLINLFKTMINSVRVTEFDWLKGSVEVWRWENLKDLNYFSLIFKNFFIYALIILAIAFVFYVGTLIIKKQVKYQKLVSITLISVIPFILGDMIVVDLAGLIFNQLGAIVAIISSVYSISLFTTLMNDELKLVGYQRLLFNVICFSVILCISYFGIVNISIPKMFE